MVMVARPIVLPSYRAAMVPLPTERGVMVHCRPVASAAASANFHVVGKLESSFVMTTLTFEASNWASAGTGVSRNACVVRLPMTTLPMVKPVSP